jgi:hypothetical protein
MLLGQTKMLAVILESGDRQGHQLVQQRNRRLRPTLLDAGLVPLRARVCREPATREAIANLSCAPAVGLPQAVPHTWQGYCTPFGSAFL